MNLSSKVHGVSAFSKQALSWVEAAVGEDPLSLR